MAKIVIGQDYGSYTFDNVTKKVTITLPSGNVVLEGLLLITDVTNNTIIYNFADPTKGATLSGNVFTLTYDTNTLTFNSTDKLQIYYYDTQPSTIQMTDMAVSLSQILKALQRPYYLDGGIYSKTKSYGGYIDAITSVNGVNYIQNLGSVTRVLEDQVNPPRATTWQLAVRNRIS